MQEIMQQIEKLLDSWDLKAIAELRLEGYERNVFVELVEICERMVCKISKTKV